MKAKRKTSPKHGRNSELDDATGGKFVRKRVSSLKPSPENEALYQLPDDTEIIKLAEVLRSRRCDPLTITLDSFIVSGHRRRLALVLNGQQWVDCRILPFRREDLSRDEYVKLLRDQNHQRHKTAAEQAREELVDIDPEEAYRNLRELRDKSLRRPEHNSVAMLEIEGSKRRFDISEDKAEHVKYILKIVEERREYWPLSVRGVHYPLLNYDFIRGYYWPRRNEPGHGTRQELHYKNDDGSYDATSDLITRLRLNHSIPWEAFDDFTRPLKEYPAFDNVRDFIRQEVGNLFSGYWRKLLQSQPHHVEVVCEKNTIYHMVLRITDKYQIPTSSGRGFNSIDPWHDLCERYRDSGKDRLIVIVLSDWDPEGEMIPQVGGRTLRDDFGVEDPVIIKAGVTRKQIEKYELPEQNFAKQSSSNFRWFVDRNDGDESVYELEALEPEDMLRDLDDVIRSIIDIDLFNREVEAEQDESRYLEAARKTAVERLKGFAE